MKTKSTLHIVVSMLAFIAFNTPAQVQLAGTNYAENFDGIGAGLPPGWSVRTNATAVNPGTPCNFTLTATNWAASSGQFANYASTISNSGTNFLGTEAPTNQAACTNRSLGIRQTGTFGDPGAAFVFQVQNTLGFAGFELSLDCNLLNAQNRSTLWIIDYGIGNNPSGFTPVDTYADPGAFGATAKTVSFGSALDNLGQPVWIRVVTTNAATGSGSRDTFGIDNFKLRYHAAGAGAPTTLRIDPGVGKVILTWTNASCSLQASPGAASAFTNVPGAGSPYTNPIAGTQKYFRLKSN
jgi:trimeric autotransporter adhesin